MRSSRTLCTRCSLANAGMPHKQETFEFLNILQVHGFPRIMGVLTHLDQFKSSKTLKNTKKTMKHRFWTEIYQGAKLFYLTGIHANGRYQKRYRTPAHPQQEGLC
jgi:ribosome biogenesis protein BMS1